MKKIASALIAASMAGMLAMPAPAAAQQFSFSMGSQDRFVGERCRDNSRLRGCNDWRENRRNWSRNDYRNWYRWNRSSIGSNIAAGIFGFAIGSALANGFDRNDRSSSYDDWDDHVARCEARYRSYNERTDMFLGYDGDYHRCNL